MSAPEQALFASPSRDRPEVLTGELDHRAIVVYHPDRERDGNYVPTVLGDRYEAFCWFAQSRDFSVATTPSWAAPSVRSSRPLSESAVHRPS